MGAESALLASLITSGAGLLGVILAKCKMIYKRDADGNCSPICAFSDKALTPEDHEIEIFMRMLEMIFQSSSLLKKPVKVK